MKHKLFVFTDAKSLDWAIVLAKNAEQAIERLHAAGMTSGFDESNPQSIEHPGCVVITHMGDFDFEVELFTKWGGRS